MNGLPRAPAAKVKTTLHARFAAEQHICTYAPIRYKKHSEVMNLLKIDEETRWIVEKIFDLAYRGAGAVKICAMGLSR